MANLVEYVKTVWENGKTALNAARMNNMEQGISNCATQINKLGDSVSRKLGNIQEADYSGLAWIVIGKDKNDADRRGLAWSDNELFIMRGGNNVAKVTLTPINVSSNQTDQKLS